MVEVKYGGSKMEQRSVATRARIVQAAYDLFCEFGFRATTMEAISSSAGVSVQTVYFQFRTKDQVLRAVHEWTVLGDDGLPPQMQPWYIEALRKSDPHEVLAKVVAGVTTLNARIAPTLPIFAALAQEPAGEIYRNSRQLRRNGMEELVTALRAKAPLRQGMTARRAADLVDFLMGPESYAELVLQAKWSPRQWATWTSATLSDQIFGPRRH
jgi:AcrR family transcriptional regulator